MTILTKKRPRWAAVETAAEHCDLSSKTIRRLIALGKLQQYRPTDKILVDLDELDAYIQSTANASPGNRGAHLRRNADTAVAEVQSVREVDTALANADLREPIE